jgi:GT2 family glycosyltransferase
MATLPRISVVTPSYNQGKYIARTIDSVLAQSYPNLEHIVVDGMSSDDTPEILARFPHLRVIREPDRGQAEAINKGFRVATGEIYCFLNSDDTFLPGALHRVAREINPAKNRHVVMGRCRFIDEDDRPTGIEHPCCFTNHRRVLEVWNTHCIPQPSTFWTAEAWRRCGPMDEGEQLVLDYDLMCRLSRDYTFHFLDQVLATYRLHEQSKTCTNSHQVVHEHASRVSRRYWGSPLGMQYWALRFSLAQHRAQFNTCNNTCKLVRRIHAKLLRMTLRIPRWTLLARRTATLRSAWNELSPLSLAYRDFTGIYGDDMVGPKLVSSIEVREGDSVLQLEGAAVIDGLPRPMRIDLFMDGRHIGRHALERHRSFSIAVAVPRLRPGRCKLSITSDDFVIPHDYLINFDYRPLSFRLKQVRLSDAA